jgi:hypothetical protein
MHGMLESRNISFTHLCRVKINTLALQVDAACAIIPAGNRSNRSGCETTLQMPAQCMDASNSQKRKATNANIQCAFSELASKIQVRKEKN